MRKSILLAGILLLIAIPNVIASTPNFEITNLLENEATNGNNDFGNLLFVEKPYFSDYHNKSVISQEIYQQYDILQWRGDSIKITNPKNVDTVLVNSSEYYFEDIGIHQITSMTNSSETAIISINPADPIHINITDINIPIGFEFNFSNNDFDFETEKSISADLSIDDDVEFGDYDILYKVNGVQKKQSIELLKVINWSEDDENLSKSQTIKSGDGIYLGRIILENKGNEDVEITVAKDGNQTGMLGIPQPQTLYRKNIMNLDFQINVPTITPAGIYEMEIIISGGGIIKTIPINITVIDAIAPTIELIDFSTDKVFVDNLISVTATDNDDVANVTITYDGETYGFKKDANLFTRTEKFTKLSRYIFNFCATDVEGNKVCQIVNKTFEQQDVIEGEQKVMNMDSMRYGKYSRMFLFNITKKLDEDIVLEIVNYEKYPVESNQTPVFRVVDDDGSIKNFGKYNSEIRIADAGNYYFEVRGDEELDINGILRATVPDQYKEIQDITFKVSFKDYDVPKDFSVNWVNGRNVDCKVEDTGNLDTSYYACELKYPIDTRASDISIPTTVQERNKFENEANDVRKELDDSKRKSGWVIGIMVAFFVLLILYTVFMVLYYPYIRMQTGKTSSNNKLK